MVLIAHGLFDFSIADILMVICTVLLTWVAFLQIKTTTRQLRAYLVPIKGELINEQDGSITVKVTIRNAGETPAYQVKGRAEIGHNDLPHQPIELKSPIDDASNMILGADVEMYFFEKLHVGVCDEIRQGSKGIHATGKITYQDIFRKRHRTSFHFIYGGDPEIAASPLMGVADFGNEFD